jgi:hypothetical protein
MLVGNDHTTLIQNRVCQLISMKIEKYVLLSRLMPNSLEFNPKFTLIGSRK